MSCPTGQLSVSKVVVLESSTGVADITVGMTHNRVSIDSRASAKHLGIMGASLVAAGAGPRAAVLHCA